MGRRPSIKKQVVMYLMDMAAFGTSKHQDKLTNGGKPRRDRIYSSKTMSDYINCCEHFVVWARNCYGCKLLDEAFAYVDVYLQLRIDNNLSGWTIRQDACALAKLYQCCSTDFGVIFPSRRRADVKRYHDADRKAAEFEAAHADMAQVFMSCGLRVHESRDLLVVDVYVDDTGKCIIFVRHGKGGKRRYVTALDNSILQFVVQARKSGRKRVFRYIPKGAPVHWYRHIFAQRLYHKLARPVHQIPKQDRYVCRAERKGIVYDKRAMRVVSKALGHNRLPVVTYYL